MQVDPLAKHSLQTAGRFGSNVHLIFLRRHSRQLFVPFLIFFRGGPWIWSVEEWTKVSPLLGSEGDRLYIIGSEIAKRSDRTVRYKFGSKFGRTEKVMRMYGVSLSAVSPANANFRLLIHICWQLAKADLDNTAC